MLIAQYTDSEENEKHLESLRNNKDVLVVSINGYRRRLADCIVHTDYNIKKLLKTGDNFSYEDIPILTFRDYKDRYPDCVVDCREFDFMGSSILTAARFFVDNNIKDILLYVPNTVHGAPFIELNRKGINEIREYHPNCNIFKWCKDGNFDTEVITIKDFISGIYSRKNAEG